MFGGMDPKKMQAVMKQMGIKQTEIDTKRVIIEKMDGGKIIIEPAQVTKINMQGQNSFQIAGETREESAEVGVSEEDIKTVTSQTGKTPEEAKAALEETGDLADAVMKLSE